MAVRSQHPEPEDRRRTTGELVPAVCPSRRKPPSSESADVGNSEVRKAATPATRAEVRLAAIQCVVRLRKWGESVCGIEYSGTLRYPSGRPLKYCIWIGLNHPNLVA